MDVHQLIELIETMISTYIEDTSKKPAAVIVGPKEYIALCEYMRKTQPELKDARVGNVYITDFQGVNLYVKEMPGVDLMIAYQSVWEYAK